MILWRRISILLVALSGLSLLYVIVSGFSGKPDRTSVNSINGCYTSKGNSKPTLRIIGNNMVINNTTFSVSPLQQIKDFFFFHTSPRYSVTSYGVVANVSETVDTNNVVFVEGYVGRRALRFTNLSGATIRFTTDSCV